MDSVPAAPERQRVGVATVLAALVLLAFAGLAAWRHHATARVEAVAEPERALAAVVGRTLDLDEGIAAAPAWERRFYETLLGRRADDLAQAIGWYEELGVVVLTPVFEEILFRGLLFATRRRGLGAPGAAVASGAFFALAHGYGALGFASVCWSACLWAWAYEKTGSLGPSVVAHAADNLGASLSVLLVLRG